MWMRDAVSQNQEAPFPEPRAGEGFAAPLGLLAGGKRKEGLQRRGCYSSYGAGVSFQVDVPSSSPTQLSLPGPWGWYARSQGSHACGASIWDCARLPRASKGGLSCLCATSCHTGRQQANTSPEGVREVSSAKVRWERAAFLDLHRKPGQQTPLPVSSFLKHASSPGEGCL